jgi:tetratricopeptide (TPR) repeat protein
LAVIYNNRGEFAAAREHARRALAVLPGNRSSHLSLARASSELGDLTTARDHYRTTIAIDSHTGRSDVTPLLGLAIVETRLQAFDQAEAAYRQIIALEPREAEGYVALGSFLASRNRDGEAMECLKQAISLQPTHIQAAYRLSVLHRSASDDAAAIDTLRAALDATPNEPTLTSQLALILATTEVAELRDPPRALELARWTVANHGSNHPLTHEALAAALVGVGDRAAARQTIEQLLNDPALPLTDAARERLRLKLVEYSR